MEREGREFPGSPGRESPGNPDDQPGVLVVDDDHLVRLMVQLGLERNGFAVWLASNGVEAIEIYRTHRERIAVILLGGRVIATGCLGRRGGEEAYRAALHGGGRRVRCAGSVTRQGGL
jgi:hypothetical protein